MAPESYCAERGDTYVLRCSGPGEPLEINTGPLREPGRVSGLGYLLCVTVEAIEPDGTVVESTITKQPKERHCPFLPVGSGWEFVADDDANNTSLYRRRRRHEVLFENDDVARRRQWQRTAIPRRRADWQRQILKEGERRARK
jgi:hypothetical protein